MAGSSNNRDKHCWSFISEYRSTGARQPTEMEFVQERNTKFGVFSSLLWLALLVGNSLQQYYYQVASGALVTDFSFLGNLKPKVSATYSQGTDKYGFIVLGTDGYCQVTLDMSGASPTTSSTTCSSLNFKPWAFTPMPNTKSTTQAIEIASTGSTSFDYYVGVNYVDTSASPNLNKGNIFKIITSDLSNVRYLSTTSTYSINSLEKVPGTSLLLLRTTPATTSMGVGNAPDSSLRLFDAGTPTVIPKLLELPSSLAKCHLGKLCLSASPTPEPSSTNFAFYVLSAGNFFDVAVPTAASIPKKLHAQINSGIVGIIPIMAHTGHFIICVQSSSCSLFSIDTQLNAVYLGTTQTSTGYYGSFTLSEAAYVPPVNLPQITYFTNKIPEFNLASSPSVTTPSFVPSGTTDFVVVSHDTAIFSLYLVRKPSVGVVANSFMVRIALLKGNNELSDSIVLGPGLKFMILANSVDSKVWIALRQDCHPTCRVCTTNTNNNCGSCYLGQGKIVVSAVNTVQLGTCQACPDGVYSPNALSFSTNTDQSCVAQPTTLANCEKYLTADICVRCTVGNFLGTDLRTCSPCISPCANCIGLGSNCTSCISSYNIMPDTPAGLDPTSTCTQCNMPGYALSNSQCLKCADVGCRVCSVNHQNLPNKCSSCDTTLLYYLSNGVTCRHFDNFTPGEGISGTSVAPCQDPHCVDCKASVATCLACDSSAGWYLKGAACLQKTQFAPREGVSADQQRVEPCADPNCLLCRDGVARCTECDTAKDFFLKTDSCLGVPQFGAAEGADRKLGTVRPCMQAFCTDCRADYQVCQACDRSLGYALLNNTCTLITMKISLIKTITPSDESTNALPPLVYIVEPTHNECPDRHEIVYQYLMQATAEPKVESAGQSKTVVFAYTARTSQGSGSSSAPVEIKWRDAESSLDIEVPRLLVKLTLQKNLPASADSLMLKIVPLAAPKVRRSAVEVTTATGRYVYSITGLEYEIAGGDCNDDYASKLDTADEKYIATQGQVAQALTGAGNIQSTSSSAAYTAVLGLDPTGTVFRMAQTLQTLNKLYFIHVPFGHILDGILKPTAYSEKERRDVLVRTSQSVAGRLYEMQVPISVAHSSVATKIWLYWFVWGCKALRHLLIYHTDFRYMKWTIYFAYWVPKLHLVFFNLVFVDFAWLAPRTLLQSRDLGSSVLYVAYVTVALMFADFVEIYTHLEQPWVWRKFKREAIPDFAKAPPKDAGQDGQPVDTVPALAQDYKQINYKKTYFEIEYNHHLVQMVTATIPANTTLEESSWAALLCTGPWYRIVLLQLVIISCQSSIKFGLIVLSACEATRIFLIIYCHKRYKFSSSIWHLLGELCQGVFITVFVLLCLFLSAFATNDQVPRSHQVFGCWLVIAATGLEYLLLLAQLVVAVVSYLWMRRKMKEHGVVAKPWNFIYYYHGKNEVQRNLQKNADSMTENEEGKKELHSASNLLLLTSEPITSQQLRAIPDIFLPVTEAEHREYEKQQQERFGIRHNRNPPKKSRVLRSSNTKKTQVHKVQPA